MRIAVVDRVPHLVAVIAASLSADDRDAAVDDAMSAAFEELRSAEAFDVTCAAVTIVGRLLGEVASVTGESRGDVLRRIALDVATRFLRGTDDVQG